MNLMYKTLLNKEFNGVPSRSERAHVVVAMIEGECPVFVVQYHHHEGVSVTSGDETNIIDNLTEDFAGADRQDYPGTDTMLEEIEEVLCQYFL